MEIVGKIPTGAEATKYKIDKGQLDWLPTVDSLPWFGSFISKHGATASAMDPSSQDSTSKGTWNRVADCDLIGLHPETVFRYHLVWN